MIVMVRKVCDVYGSLNVVLLFFEALFRHPIPVSFQVLPFRLIELRNPYSCRIADSSVNYCLKARSKWLLLLFIQAIPAPLMLGKVPPKPPVEPNPPTPRTVSSSSSTTTTSGV